MQREIAKLKEILSKIREGVLKSDEFTSRTVARRLRSVALDVEEIIVEINVKANEEAAVGRDRAQIVEHTGCAYGRGGRAEVRRRYRQRGADAETDREKRRREAD